MHKLLILASLFLLGTCGRAQKEVPVDTAGQRMLPMSATTVNYAAGDRAQKELPVDTAGQRIISMSTTTINYAGDARYYERGADRPYTGILYGKYDNGNFLTMQQYVDGKGNGFWIDFDPDGRVSAKGTYTNDKVEGPVTFYYEDGSVKSAGQYLHWKKPIGWWTYYDRAGRVVHRMRYTR